MASAWRGSSPHKYSTLDFVALDEPKAKGADAKFFLDESLVRELEISGFFKNLYENEYR